MLELTDANFQAEVLDSPQPVVVVDAWAAWCRPCLEMKPVIQKVAAHFVGQARVGELNIDANRFTAEKYEIQTLPTILIFRDGVIVKRLEGQHTKGELIKAIDAIIAASQ